VRTAAHDNLGRHGAGRVLVAVVVAVGFEVAVLHLLGDSGLLPLHAGLYLAKLRLAGQELLALLVDLALHLDLDLAQLLLLSAELLLL